MEGTFEMADRAYYGNIEVLKIFRKTREIIFAGRSKLERVAKMAWHYLRALSSSLK